MNKLHSINITKENWRLMIRLFWIVGAILFGILNSSFIIEANCMRYTWNSAIGFLLIGIGFGLVFARAFYIKGIDNIKGGYRK